MFHDYVKDLWTALIEMYAHSRNKTWIYELRQEIARASQKRGTIQSFYGYLKLQWDELEQLKPLSKIPELSIEGE